MAVGLSAARACFLLALLLSGRACWASPPATAAAFWGEVLGAAPQKLAVVVQDAGGDVLSKQDATLRKSDGRTRYRAEFPADALKRAMAQSPRAALNFQLDGKPGARPMTLTSGLPEMPLDALEGSPVPASTRIVTAQVLLRPQDSDAPVEVFALLAHDGAAETSAGTLDFRAGRGSAPATKSLSLTLEPGVTRLVRSKLPGPITSDMLLTWQVTWTPQSSLQSQVVRRVAAFEAARVVVDGLGDGPALAEAPPLAPDPKAALSLYASALKVDLGQYVAVELQADFGDVGSLRTALEACRLAVPGENGDELAWRTVAVDPLPEGGCWLTGAWRFPQAAELPSLKVTSTGSSALPGKWILRALLVLDEPARDGQY